MRLLIWLGFLSLASCTTLPKPQLESSLFPARNYQHTIDITITGTRQAYQFTGVAGLSNEGLKLYMMGPMNVTVMKITETFADGKVAIENYFEPLKPYESSIARFYPIVRNLLLFPKEQTQWGSLTVVERATDGSIRRMTGPHDISIEIRSFSDGHPSLFEIRHARFRALIKDIPK